MRLTTLAPLYIALILGLAAIGVLNQGRFNYQARLIDHKAQLQDDITDLRARSAAVRGPLAVSEWAAERGMVLAPEVDLVRHVLPVPAPETRTFAEEMLEVRTVWR